MSRNDIFYVQKAIVSRKSRIFVAHSRSGVGRIHSFSSTISSRIGDVEPFECITIVEWKIIVAHPSFQQELEKEPNITKSTEQYPELQERHKERKDRNYVWDLVSFDAADAIL